ncbi:MAG TPA: MFS transporter [Caldilineaceae bacterium]|nr:MFS transporter [Caldilineaceae bacterium]
MKAPAVNSSSRVINAVPFFYGWLIVLVGTLGSVMMGPSQTFTFGLFIDSLVNDLAISRANVSLLYGLATLGASALLPFVGRAIDRFGARRVMLVAVCGFGLACVGMANVQGIFTLLFGLLALRFLGFGSMNLTSSTMIAQWFVRRRGFVMGLAGQSLALSLLLYPPLGEWLIAQWGWRNAWVALGLLSVGVMGPMSWFFYRDRPELYGLQPDGDTHGEGNPSTIAGKPQSYISTDDWTLAEARRTAAFWLFAGALATTAMVTAGFVFHQTSLFETQGLGRSAAVQVFQVIALSSVIGNLAMGRLLDRYSARYILAGLLSLLSLLIVLVQVMYLPWHGLIYGLFMGLCSGSFRVIDNVIWAKYFGRRHLGSIRGVTMFGAIGGTALGAYPLGLSYDYFGSYRPALNSLLLIAITIGIVALFVPRPRKSQFLRS